jgi:hypothetical protein
VSRSNAAAKTVLADLDPTSLKRLAWAYGCAKKGSAEETQLLDLLVQRIGGETAIAERDYAIRIVHALVRFLTSKANCGYMPHEDQMVLRAARALLVEYGRSVEE